MDTIINSALEEICAHGNSGLPISKLWSKLHPSISTQGLELCSNVKKVLWSKLVQIPGLKFVSNGVFYNSHHDSIQLVQQCELMDLSIVAPQHLCDCFIGIYDIDASDAKLSKPERRALDCLAFLRGNGITQNDLGKKFNLKGNDMFYILKKLESRGLIVRQSTIVRTKNMAGEGDFKNPPVPTNMLYLSRYAKSLGSQQRLEITKGDNSLVDSEITDRRDKNSVGVAEEPVNIDVHVKDFLPALEAICDKLEKAEGKVLAVSDIKLDLGYRWQSGHRAWRIILKKLLEAKVVEEIHEVDGK